MNTGFLQAPIHQRTQVGTVYPSYATTDVQGSHNPPSFSYRVHGASIYEPVYPTAYPSSTSPTLDSRTHSFTTSETIDSRTHSFSTLATSFQDVGADHESAWNSNSSYPPKADNFTPSTSHQGFNVSQSTNPAEAPRHNTHLIVPDGKISQSTPARYRRRGIGRVLSRNTYGRLQLT